jgi:hypothetical protein
MSGSELDALIVTLADWARGRTVMVYLFGSRARGDHRPDSDVDISVLWRPPRDLATAAWWVEQNTADFPELKAKLPGPLKILGPDQAHYPLTLPHHEVSRKDNVIALHTPPKPLKRP